MMTDEDQALTLRVAQAMGHKIEWMTESWCSDIGKHEAGQYRGPYGMPYQPLDATEDGAAVLEELLAIDDTHIHVDRSAHPDERYLILCADYEWIGPTIWHAAARALCAVVEGE